MVAIYCANSVGSACPVLRLARPFHHAGWSVRSGTSGHFDRWHLDVTAARGADLVVVQRNLPDSRNHSALREISRMGVPIVFDLDDSFLQIPFDHPDGADFRQTFPYFRWMLKQADLVTVSTAHLVQALQPFSARPMTVMPNMVDWEWFDSAPRVRADLCNLVVSGTSSHRADWALIEQPLLDLLAERPGRVQLTFFGDLPERFKAHPAVQAVGFEKNYERYAALLRGLDAHIALVPLLDTDFNRAKSNIKWLEYSAAGIPGIYSDVEPYRAAITNGTDGVLVENRPQAWKHAMLRLVDDARLCSGLIDQARNKVLASHSITAGLPAFEQVLRGVIGTRHLTDRGANASLWPTRVKDSAAQQFERHVAWRFRRQT